MLEQMPRLAARKATRLFASNNEDDTSTFSCNPFDSSLPPSPFSFFFRIKTPLAGSRCGVAVRRGCAARGVYG